MDKLYHSHTMVYYSAIEKIADTSNNTDEFKKFNAKRKKPDTRVHTITIVLI